MKRVTFVEDVTVTTIYGELVGGYNDRGMAVPLDIAQKQIPDTKPVKFEQYKFLLERLSDQKFYAPREGFDAALFVAEARQEIEAQKDLAKERGYWEFEDERAKALLEAAMKPTGGYNPSIQHSLMPLLLAIKNMSSAS